MVRRVVQSGLWLILLAAQAVAGDYHYSYVPAINAIVYLDDSGSTHQLYRKDLSTGTTRVLWRSKRKLYFVKVHRAMGLVGFVERLAPGREKLVVITPNGKLLQEFPGEIFGYDFDPEGTRVLYATGREYDHEGAELFESLGVYVGDLATGATRKVSDLGHEVAWARHDGNCYVNIHPNLQMIIGIFRWDPATGEFARSKHKAINFSPDGKHYFRGSAYEDFALYRVSDGKEIPIPGAEMGSVWDNQVEWSDDGRRLMVTIINATYPVLDRMTVIHDFPTGKDYRIFAHVLDWGRTSDELLVEEDGQFVFRTVGSFPQF